MAIFSIYGREAKFLTGERLRTFKRVGVVDGTIGALSAIATFMTGQVYLILVVIILLVAYRIWKKQTFWQLRNRELDQGQKHALDILKGLKVEVGNGKK